MNIPLSFRASHGYLATAVLPGGLAAYDWAAHLLGSQAAVCWFAPLFCTEASSSRCQEQPCRSSCPKQWKCDCCRLFLVHPIKIENCHVCSDLLSVFLLGSVPYPYSHFRCLSTHHCCAKSHSCFPMTSPVPFKTSSHSNAAVIMEGDKIKSNLFLFGRQYSFEKKIGKTLFSSPCLLLQACWLNLSQLF